ncbi:MAG: hypothetical protein QOK49_4083 [Baekduia sp.]|jgi:hypothetical protein|nr:hypothetical protein [Baekduia sp.]
MLSPPRHVGPPLLPLALIASGLLVASLIVGAAGGGPFPSPYDHADVVLRFFADHSTTVRAAATLQFASAVPLAILAASLSSRLRFLGFTHVPGVLIASTGGILASGLLMIGALVQWVLAQPGVRDDPGVVRALADLAFATGGPGHVVCLGLLVAGVAVPATIGRLLPRGVGIAGVALALIAELSTLALPFEHAAFLLPVARFGALLWLITAAALLPARRATASTPPTKDIQHAHQP